MPASLSYTPFGVLAIYYTGCTILLLKHATFTTCHWGMGVCWKAFKRV